MEGRDQGCILLTRTSPSKGPICEALGRMIDVDIAEETTNLATYNVLSQAAASMIAQANATTDLALFYLDKPRGKLRKND